MKLDRHSQIIRLVKEYDIETQEELASRLNDSGFKVTQATVSRDIRELKLTKVPGEKGHFRYAIPTAGDEKVGEKYIHVLRTAYASMDTAGNLLVIHTVSGMAMAAAAALDDMGMSEIVGCIAGDNTIMCATKSEANALQLMGKLKKILEREE